MGFIDYTFILIVSKGFLHIKFSKVKQIILNCNWLSFLCLLLVFIFLFPFTKVLAFNFLFPLEWFLPWNLISKSCMRKDEVFALWEQCLSESLRCAKVPFSVTEAFFSAGWYSTATSTGVLLAAKWIKCGFIKTCLLVELSHT